MQSLKKQTHNEKKIYRASIRASIADLGSEDGKVREAAREKLVAIGHPAANDLAELASQPNEILRWEAFKALSSIADGHTVPLLIRAISDDNEEIRWLAAEGLIAVGSTALAPILEEFLCDPMSLRIQKGMHHILTGLSLKLNMDEIYDLIDSLNEREPELHAPRIAYTILKNVGRSKYQERFCDGDARIRVA